MRKFIIRLLLKWYVSRVDDLEVVKLSGLDELRAYTFKSPVLTEKMIKSILTAQTLWHFEARSEEERIMAKGAALILKIIKDAHEASLKSEELNNPDKSLENWRKYKKNHRIN